MRDLPLAPVPRVRRRDVLKAGAVGAGAILLPARSSAAVPTGLHRDVRELMAAGSSRA